MRSAKILLVEDEANVLAINKEFLEGQGLATCCAATLDEARMLLDEAPDLILLDVMLPDGMGWDFADEIRAQTNAPIIYLTCRGDNESVIKGLTKGGDEYVVKPYDLHVLYARILSALRRSGFSMAGVIEAPPLYIDMLSGSVTIGDEMITLSQKEMQLLCCLALDAGRYQKCEDLYRRAWGEPVGNYANAVAVYVSHLRSKLRLAKNGLFEIRATPDQEYILIKTAY